MRKVLFFEFFQWTRHYFLPRDFFIYIINSYLFFKSMRAKFNYLELACMVIIKKEVN